MTKLHFDFGNLMTDVVGVANGLSDDQFHRAAPDVARAVDLLAELGTCEGVTFLQLPEQDLSAILDRASADRATFRDMLVLGIGGSSLGTRAIYAALTRRHSGAHLDGSARAGLRLHFIENVDPVDTLDLLGTLDLEHTVVNVVTKSGNTIETMSTFFIVRDLLTQRFGEDGACARIVVTTDPDNGALRAMAKREGYHCLPVPPEVGGRFSVLSAVGLYPLAAAGLDIVGLLRGAAAARDIAWERDVYENPAAMFALTQYLAYNAGRPDVVFMPYAQNLTDTAAWFVQLWAESLGKLRRHPDGSTLPIGPTPIAALGVTDQHSQLQLYMEGPATKTVVFVEVEEFHTDTSVPPPRMSCESLSHLGGKTLSQLMAAELAGVREGLAETGRPTATIRLRRISPETVGALLMFLECAVSIAGTLFDVDPYNQPGVELGKRFAHGLLGREKEKHYATKIRDAIASRTKRTISF